MQKNRAGKDVSDGSFQKKLFFFPFLENKKLTFTTSMQTFAETFVEVSIWQIFHRMRPAGLVVSNLAGLSRIAVLLLGFLKGDIMIDAVTPYGEDWARTILGSLCCVGDITLTVSLSPPMSVN